ncbi:MAG: DUF3098 domain-containing protein [Bacteroidia bacterium]|nr:DUF3098 domain-containing protein [Bacteroidia bacterium]
MARDVKQPVKSDETIYFDKINYICLIAGIGLVFLGYMLMIGGGSDDPNIYNKEIFSARRITVAPITCLLGFAVLVYAIMRRPKVVASETDSEKFV